jgi:hypothetical protein
VQQLFWASDHFSPHEDVLADRRPEIILTDKAGELLEVDALAYPEDTHLIVDPYAVLEESKTTVGDLVAEAEATLPRPLGEIIAAKAKGLLANRLFRLVLLDFERQRHCQAKVVEDTLRKLVWQVTLLKSRRLGLDRFELLEPCISAYRVLSCLCDQVQKMEAAGSGPPRKLIFSIKQPAVLRRYQVALENLPEE